MRDHTVGLFLGCVARQCFAWLTKLFWMILLFCSTLAGTDVSEGCLSWNYPTKVDLKFVGTVVPGCRLQYALLYSPETYLIPLTSLLDNSTSFCNYAYHCFHGLTVQMNTDSPRSLMSMLLQWRDLHP